MTYPDGRVLNFVYNPGIDADVSRLSSITSTPSGGTASALVESYTYLGRSIVHAVTRGNGVIGNTTLDQFGRVGNLVWFNGTTGAVVDNINYQYDFNSNVTVKQNLASTGNSETYGYDSLDRLTSFARGTLSGSTITTPSTSGAWTLDAQGNWNSHTNGATTTIASFNTQNQNKALGYDANGNQTTDENGATLKYDAWNQCVQYSGTSGTVLYAYDALGRRNAETTNSVTTNLLYSVAWQVIQENQSGSMIAQNVFSPTYVDAVVQRTVVSGGTPTTYWFEHDANYNTISLSNGSGIGTCTFLYDPYGSVNAINDNTGLGGALLSTVKYLSQGRRLDTTTGLYDGRHRIYDPVTGTWKQADPIGYTGGGPNLQQFVGSNPVRSVDPMGTEPLAAVPVVVPGFPGPVIVPTPLPSYTIIPVQVPVGGLPSKLFNENFKRGGWGVTNDLLDGSHQVGRVHTTLYTLVDESSDCPTCACCNAVKMSPVWTQ